MAMLENEENKARENVRTVSYAEALETGMPRDVLIALHEAEGVGRVTIASVFLYGVMKGPGSLRHTRDFLAGDWRDMGLSARQALAAERGVRPAARERREDRHRSGRMGAVTYLDDDYPALLREISDPPWVLYFRGRLELTDRPAIAIVGTRLATGYGRKVAEELAEGCAGRMTVVSGLAKGIDAAAHRGAVSAAYGTIAVLAGGVDRCYPPENLALYREIGEQGLLLAESPPDTILRPGLFPLRNRIIAGLSYGVVVVEAARRSGALITAELALGYDRDVFVVPGQVTSPRSLGGLEYFRKGAHPVLDASDIFQYYEYRLPRAPEPEPGSGAASREAKPAEELDPDELAIYLAILERPSSINELSAVSGMTFGHLHSVLLNLLMKRRIQQLPGSVYHVL
ncbi:DNA-processing protein DprA [Cohnella hongkongensis]|uniref:DNA-processing protein DprA n=1 Tax=Cohnella hongkongensis TaxID=178337 RepID=A0ABV9FD20_9BACL